jgi:hypothetical protein
MRIQSLWLFIFLTVSFAAQAQSITDNWEPVLVPVYIDTTVPGTNGSLWRTIFWIQNGGTQNLHVAPWTCNLPPGVCITTFPTATTLTPGQSRAGAARKGRGGSC